jgi:hypothetical protein
MGTVRAYLLSLLGVQRLKEGPRFTTSHPHPWLVWEPGVWQPAGGGRQDVAMTRLASVDQPVTPGFRPSTGDSLCFELVERRALKVGRAQGCDVQINDATVSREHLLLEPDGGSGWTIRPAAPGKLAQLNGTPLGGEPAPLKSRDQLRLGDVAMTFYGAGDLVARLDEQANAKPAPAPRKSP